MDHKSFQVQIKIYIFFFSQGLINLHICFLNKISPSLDTIPNTRYVSICTHDPDVVQVPHHVHNKYRTVSVSILVTPDQPKISKKYVPTGTMKLIRHNNSCDGHSMNKLRIGNSRTKIVIIEGNMSALNSSSDVKLFLVLYEQTETDQQDYAVISSEHFISIESKNTTFSQEQLQMLSNNCTLPTTSFYFSEEIVGLLFLYQINNMLDCPKIKCDYIIKHFFYHKMMNSIVILHWQRNDEFLNLVGNTLILYIKSFLLNDLATETSPSLTDSMCTLDKKPPIRQSSIRYLSQNTPPTNNCGNQQVISLTFQWQTSTLITSQTKHPG